MALRAQMQMIRAPCPARAARLSAPVRANGLSRRPTVAVKNISDVQGPNGEARIKVSRSCRSARAPRRLKNRQGATLLCRALKPRCRMDAAGQPLIAVL